MKPVEPKELAEGLVALADPGRDYLVFALNGGSLSLDLSDHTETFTAAWVDPKTGRLSPDGEVRGGKVIEWKNPANRPAVLWLTRK